MPKRLGYTRVQINISIPAEWKEDLEKLARTKAYQEDRKINFSDLIREAIADKYGYKMDFVEKVFDSNLIIKGDI